MHGGGVFGYRFASRIRRGSVGGAVSIRSFSRVALVASLGLFAVVGSGFVAIPARAAQTTTLSFYSVEQTYKPTNAAGQPITDPNATLMAGDHYVSTDRLYVGDHKHHASRSTASDRFGCMVVSATTQTCSIQTTLGGSLLLSNDVTLPNVASPTTPVVVPINGGTGKYKNARGTLASTGLANFKFADEVITLGSAPRGRGPSTIAVTSLLDPLPGFQYGALFDSAGLAGLRGAIASDLSGRVGIDLLAARTVSSGGQSGVLYVIAAPGTGTRRPVPRSAALCGTQPTATLDGQAVCEDNSAGTILSWGGSSPFVLRVVSSNRAFAESLATAIIRANS
jgi:hypothetical protein